MSWYQIGIDLEEDPFFYNNSSTITQRSYNQWLMTIGLVFGENFVVYHQSMSLNKIYNIYTGIISAYKVQDWNPYRPERFSFYDYMCFNRLI